MKVLLILVSLSQGDDVPPVTAEFASMAECENEALAIFAKSDERVEVVPFEGEEEAALMDNMKVAWGADGNMLGMFSCASLSQAGE